MKAAPAFSAVLSPEPVWRLTSASLVGATSGVVLVWMEGHGLFAGSASVDPFAQAWQFRVVLAMLVAAAVWWWPGLRACRLVWDGQRWFCGPPDGSPSPCRPTIALDLGSWLLIRVRPLPTPRAGFFSWDAARTAWIAVSRRSAAGRWHPLRVALNAHAQSLARPAGEAGDVGGARAP